jgi:hypothetical protein
MFSIDPLWEVWNITNDLHISNLGYPSIFISSSSNELK